MSPATSHFFAQRLTAILLVPMGLWFVIALKNLNLRNLDAVIQWLQKPRTLLLMTLLLICLFYHAYLGLKTIIEDYISTPTTQTLWLNSCQWIWGLSFATGFVFLVILFLSGPSQ